MSSEEERKPRVISRREMLHLMGYSVAAATILAGCKVSTGSPEGPDAWIIGVADDPGAQSNLLQDWGAWAPEKNHPLVFENPWGQEGYDLKLYPKFADSWEVIDNQTVRLHLRKGVKFHDGTEMKASDVKFTYETVSSTEGTLWNSMYTYALTQVDVIDDYTCDLKMAYPFSSIFSAMASCPGVLPQATRESMGVDAFNLRPVGTGPYKVVADWKSGSDVELEAFDDYHGGKPFPTKLTLRHIPDPTTRAAELLAGNVHIIADPTISDQPMLEADPNINVFREKGTRWIMYQMNALHPQLGIKEVRQAINYSIDRDVIVDDILEGNAKKNVGFLPEGWLGHLPELGAWPYDPDKARALLAGVGLTDQVEFRLETIGLYPREFEVAEAVSLMLKEVGITANVDVLEHVVSQQNYYAGNYETRLNEWPVQLDPYLNLTYVFEWAPGMMDFADYDPLRKKMSEALATFDKAELKTIWEDFNRMAFELCPVISIYSMDVVYACRKEINWEPVPWNGMWGEVWLADRSSFGGGKPSGTLPG